MAQPLDYVEYLSKEIGARPAGTEEEQQAALYIADEFQEEAGFNAAIEEFTSSSNLEGGRAILSMITVVVSVLAMLFNILTVPALVLALVAAVIYVLEAYDKPVLSSKLSRGASQNVVAKYQPAVDPQAPNQGLRQRKIVLVAHYDTGKVTPGIIQRAESMNLPLAKVSLAGMVAAPFFLLLRLFLGGTGGAGLVFINLLTIIAILLVAMPIVKAILYRIAPYNEGANNNATGVAALLEIAQRISSGSLSEADLIAEEADAVVHGEQAARTEGLVPEGATLTYDVDMTEDEFENASEEDRLLAAKAAIAALTGRPVEQQVYAVFPPEEQAPQAQSQWEDEYPEPEDRPIEAPVVVESAFAPIDPTPAVAAGEEVASGFENAPSWFIAAQRNAKKSDTVQPVQKSRYTSAIQAAEDQLAAREQARIAEERAQRQREQLERERASRAALAAMVEAPRESAPADPAGAGEAAAEAFASSSVSAQAFEAFSGMEGAPEAALGADVNAGADELVIPVVSVEELISEQGAVAPAAEAQPLSVDEPFIEADETISAPGLFEERLEELVQPVEPEPAPEPELEPAPAPATAEEEPAVDLGQTIAYSPSLLRQAIQDELERETDGLAVEQDDAPAQDDGLVQGEVLEQDAAQPEALPADSARLNLKNLPSLNDDAPRVEGVPEVTNPSRSGLFRMLRTDVPSLSGVIAPVAVSESMRDALLKSSQLPKIVVEGDHTGVDYSMEIPIVMDEQLPKIDIPVVIDEEAPARETQAEPNEPVRDQAAEEQDTESRVAESRAAEEQDADMQIPAPRGQVDVPKSRAGGFLKRLRSKEGAQLDDTPQEWLDVDEDFEAREAGRERGSWASFREDGASDAPSEGTSKRTWEGGAFSRIRLGHVNTRSGVEEDDEIIEEFSETVEDQELSEEIEQIYHFRNPDFNAEIWFVAIGSDTELHDGARAFMEEHKHELRGAMVIELESLGVGELCVASEEGQFKKMQASSRIKRFTRGASEATGIVLGQVRLPNDSITTVVQKSGMQAMHLMGVEDGRPALKGSADDIFENVDELVFEENINYVMELLKQD